MKKAEALRIKQIPELLWRFKFSLAYILFIPLVNVAFVYVPTFKLGDGGEWSPLSIVVGLILVFRDFAQREIGHFIFIPLGIGVFLSWYLAGPEIAVASGIAFFISETADWLVYTLTKRPLSQRVLISSLVSVPIDTVAFLTGANMIRPGIFSPSTFLCSLASKLVAAFGIYILLKRRERLRSSKYEK